MNQLLREPGVLLLLLLAAMVVIMLLNRFRSRPFSKTIVLGSWPGSRALSKGVRSLVQVRVRAVSPARVHLARRAEPSWVDAVAVKDLVEPLQRLGFQDAGMYSVEGIDGLQVQGLVKPDLSITAVVLE